MTTAAAAAVAALPWIAAAQAQGPGAPPPHGREMGRGFEAGRLAEELGLSDEQKTQVEAIHKKTWEVARPLMEASRQAHEAFRTALEADNADPTTVGQAALAMHAAEKKLQAVHESAMAEVKAILTPEQRAKLDQLHARGPHDGPRGPRF